MKLNKRVICSRCSNENFEDIYLKFKKKINFLVMSFNIELYKNDLLLFLWQLIKKTDISNFKSEQALHAYISIALKNHCISIYHNQSKNSKICYNSILTNIEMDKNCSYNYMDNSIFVFSDLISSLSAYQKKIITMRYKDCLSDFEIATSLNISRQAVFKNRRAALNKLQETYKYFLDNGGDLREYANY